MTVDKIITPPTKDEVVDKINEVIDNLGGQGTAPVWGNISGTLSNQTDLQSALDGKQDTLSSTQISNIAKGGTALQPSDVDSALSTTSENPVQNKVITSALPDITNLSYYGTCSTAAATQAKVVDCPEFTELKEGVSIRVKFTNAQSYNGQATLNVNSTGAKGIVHNGTTKAVRYCWAAGEVVSFTYNGTDWVMEDAGIASVSYYGYTRLTSSATTTSVATSLTPLGLNNLVGSMIEPYPVYTATATYAVGDRVRYSYNAWECNTAITTAEAWNANHWTALDPIQTQIDDISLNQVTSVNNVQPVNGNVTLTIPDTSNLANKDLSNLSSTGNSKFQVPLVSGTNIKSINNNSILGSGDISLPTSTDLNGKADTDLSNINPSQSAKAEITSWGMPDYANGIAIGSANKYEALVDGYYVGRVSANSGDVRLLVTLYDNSNTIILDGVGNYAATNEGNYRLASITLPVPKGYKITVGSVLGTLYISRFYPMKGAN